ncbi:BnaA01g31560D [Brassica napus]|uniref:BnaA01g31560D protein n=1 Tax=Brassica napus TaxID=3708 RepID=A0A078HX85_BRANA|nr:BnaA01g31560D [Brassica napus]
MGCQDIQVSKITTSSSTPQVQEDNQIASPTLAKILSPLVDIESTPISASIMETSPSNIINKEVQKTLIVDPLHTLAQASGFESPSRFTALGDVEEAPDEPMSSLGLTKGLREIRPPKKFQDLEWKTARGRGKRGCRGRGNTR